MYEAGIALLISLVAGAIGFGVLKQQVLGVEKLSDERHQNVTKEIDLLKTEYEVLNDINVSIAEIKKDIQFIREQTPNKKAK